MHHPHTPLSRRPALRPLAAAVASALVSLSSSAAGPVLPSGLTVVNGHASVNTSGSAMTVTNSANAILNWNSFSIGAGQSVQFQQPSAASQVLNRVTGTDPSSILGSLSSNGRVWLLNPNGVIFGAGARVDVGGLVASTLQLNDTDWLAGRYRFSAVPNGSGAVVNEGEIRTTLGGRVLLLGAGDVQNQGVIQAPGGQVALAAGQSIEVVDTGAPNVALKVTAPQGRALNLGSIAADGGRIDLQAAVVNQQGVLRADALSTGPHGEIVLKASDSLQLQAGSLTQAKGGQVTADAGAGETLAAGAVDVSSTSATGGQVQLLGRHVALLDGAVVDASGAQGGGRVLVGGGAQGRDASVPNAEATFMAPGARISADATVQGDGGHIVLWSDQATRAYGSLTARGGASGGNGGLIETSGGWLDARPAFVSTTAAAGKAGQWLLDPNDILISDSVSDTAISGSPNFTTSGDSAQISTATLQAALQAGNNVTISTGTAAPNTQQGDINVQFANLVVAAGTPVTLTLRAHHDIAFDSSNVFSDSSFGNALGIDLTAGLGGNGGSVLLRGSSLGSKDGNISIKAPTALQMSGSIIDAAGGRIAVNADQVQIDAGSFLSSLASGDAVVVRGFSTPFVTSYTGDPQTDPFSLDGGRYLIYAANPGALNAAGLSYTFVAYNNTTPATLPDQTNNGIVYNQAPTLGLSGSASKLYDQGTAISLAGAGLAVTSGQVNGDLVTVSSDPTVLTGNFADANAGTGKPITVNPGAIIATDPSGHTVYGYALGPITGSITPLTISASGTPNSKVYDGTTLATVGNWTLFGVLPGDTVSAVTNSAQFADANVGTGKSVTGSAVLTGAQAGNYVAAPGGVLGLADITPATLTYVAQPVQLTFGTPLPAAFTGSVTGFVTGETLASATTGTLSFATTAPAQPAPGQYAVNGSGLAAANYVFVQSAGNATALTVSTQQSQQPANDTAVALAQNTPPPQPPAPPDSSPPLLDATQATQPDPNTGTVAFEPLPVSSLPPDRLSRLLQAREAYKQGLFAGAITQLQQQPGLADLPPCLSVKQLEAGTCLITDALKQQLQGEETGGATQVAQGGVAPAASTASSTAASPPPASATAPVAAPASPAAPATVAAAPTASPALAPLLPTVRSVKTAALPQIRRKVALVIGIDRYADRRIPQLENAVGDARAIGSTFERTLGYETLVLENATKEQIVAALNRLAFTLRPQDSVVIYYAGHGTLVQGTGLGYWQTANADPENPRTWISNTDIGKLIGEINAQQVALISDSCYSGSLVGSERIRPSSGPLDPSQLLGRKAAVAMSSGGNEPVADEGKQGHSPFAWSLMQSLQQLQGWQPGGNVFERVRFAVARELPQRPQYGAAPLSGHQPGTDYLFERRELAGVQ